MVPKAAVELGLDLVEGVVDDLGRRGVLCFEGGGDGGAGGSELREADGAVFELVDRGAGEEGCVCGADVGSRAGGCE